MQKVLERNIYCVIYIILLSHQDWVKYLSVKEFVKTVFVDMITSKKFNQVIVLFKPNMDY